MDILKDVVLNFFFIFVCYCLFVSFGFKKRGGTQVHKFSFILFALTAVILCVTFPIQVTEKLWFDLSLVPIAIAGLYGGWRICLLLSIALIGSRLLWGMDEIYLSMIVVALHTIFIGVLSIYFRSLSHQIRILLSVIVGLVSPLLVVVAVGFVLYEFITPVLFFTISLSHLLSIIFFVVLSETIIKVKKLDEHVIRSEKMEIVNHVASSFTHEIRNPMTTVKGFLQLLKSDGISRVEKEKYISIAVSEVERAESIITEYLSFTKPTTNDLKVVDGAELLQSSIDVIRPLANSNCIDIQYNNSSFFVRANRQKLQQALINLFKNGIEAMPDGGTLYISAESKKDVIFLTIRDNGIGMTKKQVNRLGEPYFSSKGEKGTGLGMMVVYNIIEAIGGTIHVVSKPGKGTTFLIKLPQCTALGEEEVTTESKLFRVK
ncbi:ATP-binding protein [Alkalihalobacterium chitinilyticum]|uniref:histidine kinase n=1 Tax=Alkalihalobacterium chitinilyticum TaxID=2980103 RepID=A0ABT5VGJ7_9BACI|nr:ATP-binding protein [Alkalihalobacterium chitinilyticum]MDE5414581.1 ATP-binding protein [Alkalihalobacterium chitinilyticum]